MTASRPDDPSHLLPAELAGRHLIVFDGVCVLCSGFAKMVARLDSQGRFRFATAQSPLGTALFRHYGLPTEAYATNLVIIDRVGYQKMESLVATMQALGWPWRAAGVLLFLPKPFRDWLYRRIASNRYALFGRKDSCELPSDGLRDRLIG